MDIQKNSGMHIGNAYPNTFGSNAYASLEDYFLELIQWSKQWVSLYCKSAVTAQPTGELQGIGERILFSHELEKLEASSFTGQEIKDYSLQVKELSKKMQRIHQKGSRPLLNGGFIPMEYLYRIYQFSEFEWFMVVMAFMPEADPQFERVFCLLQDDYEKKMPSIELCTRMFTFDKKRWYRMQEQVVHSWKLLCNVFRQLEESFAQGQSTGSIFSTMLKLDERIINYIYHAKSRDDELTKIMKYYDAESEIAPMLIREHVPQHLCSIMDASKGSFIFLSGAKGSGKKLMVHHACAHMKKKLLVVDIKDLTMEDYYSKRFMLRIKREALLMGGAMICFPNVDLKEPSRRKIVERILFDIREAQHAPEAKHAPEVKHSSVAQYSLEAAHKPDEVTFQEYEMYPIFTSDEEWDLRLDTSGLHCLELKVEPLNVEERVALWKGLLNTDERLQGVDFERLADRYNLTPAAICMAIEEVRKQYFVREVTQKEKEPFDTQKELYKACQKQMIHKLGDDAVRIKVQYSMEDLILPRSQKKLLRNACDIVEYRHLVYRKWGFDKKLAYGKGVSILFYGPSGTGKTMGAQAVAGELNLELFRVDMSSVLSKYVGESEKKLGNIFEQGQKSQSILFFDEADALFGKRSEVKDAQDKYANASTAYLLQKIEDYEGIVILATNLLQNFDTAFSRRFQFIIEFPLPDVKNRLIIWKKMFPDQMPLEEKIDFEYLAEQFVFSGSQIKNIAVAAAFLAAGEQKSLNMFYILDAMRKELKKSGKNMIGTDFGKYQSLME